MKVWRGAVQWFKDHPFVTDSILAFVLTAIALPAMWFGADAYPEAEFRDPNVVSFLLALATTVPLAFRRRDPVLVFVVITTSTVVYEAVGFPTINGLGALLAVYTVAAHCERRRSLIVLGVTAVALAIVLITARWAVDVGDIIANFVVFFTVWIGGDNLQTRRKYVANLEERAQRAEQDKAAEAQQAVDAERARIARELHDVVAHSMSVMIVQAGAARRVVQADPVQAAEAIGQVEATGREAMTEMRRLLGVLRQDDSSTALAPQPTLAGVDRLLEQCGQAGLDVSLAIEGDRRELPPGVELSAFRIVQEALTNTLKHAGPATAEVRISYRPDTVDIEVLDDGRGVASRAGEQPDSGGHGILGMHERVDVCGGDLETGPRPGGGFAVRARLPTDTSVPATSGR